MKRTLEYSIVAILSLLFFAFYQFQTDFLPGTDGYYHIKIAYMMREMGFLSNFKWAHLSLWCDHFSDKEFLFHVYLIPFTYFHDLKLGAKIGTIILAAAGAISYYAILRLNKIKYAWFWLLLLSMAGGFFLYRANVTRPQILSILLALWSIHFIINRKLIHLAILCFIYTYSYTAYHLPFVFACIVYFYQLIFEKENDWKLPVVTLAATIVGMLLSPFFPNNWQLFYLQNFYILWMGSSSGINLHMGGEFGPMDTRGVIKVNTAVVVPYMTAFFTALYAPMKWDKKTKSLFLISLALIFLTCFSKRFAEYSVPVTLLFCAFFFNPYLEKLDWKQGLRTIKGKLIAIGVIILLIGLGKNSYENTVYEFRGAREPTLKPAALYLKENTEDDELIYTADWDDAPELFFYNHKNRYLVFLDPNFMYYWDKEVYTKWNALSNGRMGDHTYDALKNDFQVRYGVATNNFDRLREIIERDERMEIVFRSPGAYVFKLDTNYKQPPFEPPTVAEVTQFFIQQKGFSPDEARQKAIRFYEFYAPRDWIVGEGKKMTDWKYEASRSLTWEE